MSETIEDRPVWAGLPREILGIVITQIDDPATLEAMCKATRSDPNLYHVCLRKRWSAVLLGHDDFFTAPHSCTRPEHQPPMPKRLVGTLTNARPSTGQIPFPTLAAYIECLTLNLDFPLTDDLYGDLPEDFEPAYGCPEDVTFEDVDYSLVTLFPHLKSLSQLNLDGVLYQEQLEKITDIKSQSLRTLHLRQSSYSFPLLHRHGDRLTSEDAYLRWDCLPRLQHLRRLEIGQIFPAESASLVETIGKLHRLEKFLASSGPSGSDHDWYGTRPASLEHLLNLLFLHNSSDAKAEHPRLPQSLRSLAFLDDFTGDTRVISAVPQKERAAPSPDSQDLYMDIDDLGLIQLVLKARPLPGLHRLALPCGALSSLDQAERQLGPLIDRHTSTLEQITILNVWAMDAPQSKILDTLFDDAFTVEDLVLGTKNHRYYRLYPPALLGTFARDRRTLQTPDQDFYGYDVVSAYQTRPGRKVVEPRWSGKLQRIRVDQIEFSSSVFDHLSPATHPSLRILVTRPWKIHWSDFRTDDGNDPLFSSLDLLYLTKTPEAAEEEAQSLAEQVLKRRLPMLQVLVLGGYWFWISRERSTSDGGVSSKVWRFSDAQSNPIQSAEMIRSLSDRDWSFLKDVPDPPAKESPTAHTLFEEDPSPALLRRRNYMVFYRHDAMESPKPRHRILRHERSLTDRAAFVQ